MLGGRLETALWMLVVAGCGAAAPAGGTLVEVADEAAGARCAKGGVVAQVGVDLDGDARLGADEVRVRSWLCTAGEDAPVVDVEYLEEHESCEGAGAIHLILEHDLDGDGDLADHEQLERVLCQGFIEPVPGEIVVAEALALTGAAQAASLAWTKRLEGSLVLHPHSGATSLPELVTITGSLELRPPFEGPGPQADASVRLPKLTGIEGDLRLATLQELGAFETPALTQVGGALTVTQVSWLDELSFPALTSVGRDVRFADSGLVRIRLPKLARAEDVAFVNDDRLELIELPRLTNAASLVITGNDRLGECAALEVRRVLREAGFEGVVAIENNGGEGLCPNTAADCTEASVEGRTVLYCEQPRNFTNAEADCSALGGGLFMPKSAAYEAAFQAAKPGWFPGEAWIGLTDRQQEGSFVWLDGSALEHANWGSGEPNDSGGVEDCAQLTSTGRWNDRNCSELLAVACELP